MAEDLSIAGPGSPVSLKKFFLHHSSGLKDITVLVDGTGCGIAKDADCIYITPEECSTQALYYSKKLFDGKRVPAYLYRYIQYMMFDEKGYGAMKYPTDQDLVKALEEGSLNAESEEYKQIVNFIQYCEYNTEAQQVIGLIQLIGGTLNSLRKRAINMRDPNQASVRIYIDRPETALHPKRQSRFMSLFHKLKDEYGYKETTEPTA